jgi:hypothetical protein
MTHRERTGRTHAMLVTALEAAKRGEGVAIVAHNVRWIRTRFEELARELAPALDVRYIDAQRAPERIRGMARRVFVDHHAWMTLKWVYHLAKAVDHANERWRKKG